MQKPRSLILLACLPLLFTILAWTNEYHLLFWSAFYPEVGGLSQALESTLGMAGLASFAVGSGFLLLGSVLIVKTVMRARGQLLGQLVVLLACTIFPWAGSVIDGFSLTGIHAVHLTPFLLNLTALVFLFGLTRYRLLNIIPIAYQNMVDGMRDGILVLSLENRIVHLNPPAQAILGVSLRELVGRSG